MAEARDWRSCANRHLLAHIMKQAKLGVHYVSLEDRVSGRVNFPSSLAKELSKILLCHAHAWSLDMAEWPHPPSAAEQRESWMKAMECADLECEKVRNSSQLSNGSDNALRDLL